jgi:hypothetical protein
MQEDGAVTKGGLALATVEVLILTLVSKSRRSAKSQFLLLFHLMVLLPLGLQVQILGLQEIHLG